MLLGIGRKPDALDGEVTAVPPLFLGRPDISFLSDYHRFAVHIAVVRFVMLRLALQGSRHENPLLALRPSRCLIHYYPDRSFAHRAGSGTTVHGHRQNLFVVPTHAFNDPGCTVSSSQILPKDSMLAPRAQQYS